MIKQKLGINRYLCSGTYGVEGLPLIDSDLKVIRLLKKVEECLYDPAS